MYSHVGLMGPYSQFLVDFSSLIEAFKGPIHVTTHRFVCLAQRRLSLASLNPSRDANTLLRYPSTWQIRLLAGWLAELRAECWSQFSRSDYSIPLIVRVWMLGKFILHIIQQWFSVI